MTVPLLTFGKAPTSQTLVEITFAIYKNKKISKISGIYGCHRPVISRSNKFILTKLNDWMA